MCGWVVGYRPEAVGCEVSWLASDYQIYSDAVTSFDVDPAWLAERFGKQNQALQQMAGAEGLSQVRSSHGVHR